MPEPYEKTELRAITGDTLRPGGLNLTRRGVELCGWRPGDLVLDLGCGPGQTLGLLRSLGIAAWGLDKSEKLLQEAAQRGPVIRADAANPPLADAALDGVTAECVLSLLPDKAAVLQELRRALKPGGRLLLSDLFVRVGNGCADGAAMDNAGNAPCAPGPETLPRLQELLKESGFRTAYCLDVSECLVQLAVNMIFKFGSQEEFFRQWGLAACPAPGTGKKLGYALLVAEATN